MKTQWSLFAAAAVVLVASSLPAMAGVDIEIGVRPPPPRAVVVPPPPRPHVVWAPGYWRWNGREHIWIDGRYIDERPHSRWVPEHWVQRGPSWRFVPGHWSRPIY